MIDSHQPLSCQPKFLTEADVRLIVQETLNQIEPKINSTIKDEFEKLVPKLELHFQPKIDERVIHKINNHKHQLNECFGYNLEILEERIKFQNLMRSLKDFIETKDKIGNVFKDKVIDKVINFGLIIIGLGIYNYFTN